MLGMRSSNGGPAYAARGGLEHWTLRCTSCGRIDQMQVNTDPLESEALGWIEGELRPPR